MYNQHLTNHEKIKLQKEHKQEIKTLLEKKRSRNKGIK